MNKRILIKIILIVLACLFLIGGIYFYCDYRLGMTKVYIAKYNLSNRTLISEEEIEEVKVPLSYLSDEVYLDKEDIIGKYVKIDSSIPKGSFFYRSSLDDVSNMKDKITTYLKENEVSFDIDRNDIKVNPAYLLKGMYVDLYLTISKEKVVSDLLVNNVRIIGLYDSNGNEIKDYDEEAILDMITISLDESYVSYLNKAIKVGELSVVLKADAYNDEESILNTDSVIFKYLQ